MTSYYEQHVSSVRDMLHIYFHLPMKNCQLTVYAYASATEHSPSQVNFEACKKEWRERDCVSMNVSTSMSVSVLPCTPVFSPVPSLSYSATM